MLTGEKLTGTALSLQQNAFTYLHQSALDEYKEILKAQKEGVKFTVGVSGSILQYLYLIAIPGEQVPATNKAAIPISSLRERMLTSPSMDTKAVAAIVLDKAGRKKEGTGKFVASLKEFLTKT
jgi:hypothetical protein